MKATKLKGYVDDRHEIRVSVPELVPGPVEMIVLQKEELRPSDRLRLIRDFPTVKGVRFTGDPRLRREDLYDDDGR